MISTLKKVSALGLALTLIPVGSIGADRRDPLLPFNESFGLQALASRSLEQDRSPFVSSPEIIPILAKRELRNWLIDMALANRKEEMELRARRYLHEFLNSSAEGTVLYLSYRLGNAWDIPLSVSDISTRMKARDALTILISEVKIKIDSLPANRRQMLDGIWRSSLWSLIQELTQVAGADAEDITLELSPQGGYTLRVWVAQWSDEIFQWAQNFKPFLERTIPDASLTGKQEILYFNRVERPKELEPPRRGSSRKRWGWLGRLWMWPPSSLSRLAGSA